MAQDENNTYIHGQEGIVRTAPELLTVLRSTTTLYRLLDVRLGDDVDRIEEGDLAARDWLVIRDLREADQVGT